MRNFKKVSVYLLLFAIIAITFNGCKKKEEPETKDDPIIKKDVVINWENPDDINNVTELSSIQLNATADIPGTFIYTPAIGAILNVGENQDLKVDFTPTESESYNAASKIVKINVIAIVKTDPVITWINPADITLPTALGGNQLNAKADVPGTFDYTPTSGIVLSIGTDQNLEVKFTPTDEMKYNTVSKTVVIDVTSSGTVTDYDGNIYNTVVIGEQTWTVENLKVTHYRNGDPITNVTDKEDWAALTTEAYCFYDNSIENKYIYGALYNWYAVVDTRNIAPIGWHVPTDDEWTALINYLGGANVAGGEMKEAGNVHWNAPNTGAKNSSGLTILPNGDRGSASGTGMEIGGEFLYKGKAGCYWSSTELDATIAFNRYFYYTLGGVYRENGFLKMNGYGVRLVKD